MEGGRRQNRAKSSSALKYALKKLTLIFKTVVVIAGEYWELIFTLLRTSRAKKHKQLGKGWEQWSQWSIASLFWLFRQQAMTKSFAQETFDSVFINSIFLSIKKKINFLFSFLLAPMGVSIPLFYWHREDNSLQDPLLCINWWLKVSHFTSQKNEEKRCAERLPWCLLKSAAR